MWKTMCQLQNNFSNEPPILFSVQATFRIFLQFKIAGSKFQKPYSIYLFFTLAKDEECRSVICTYVLAIGILFFIFKKKKKKDPSFSLGKKTQKLCHNCPTIYLFSMKGRETLIPQTLLKTLKYCKVHFLTNPYNALVQTSSVSVIHLKIVKFC